jgi:hypothetical protein
MLRARRILELALAATFGLASCSEPTNPPVTLAPSIENARTAATTSPTVTSTVPSASPRGTTLDVQINGSGFDNGSQATMPLHGVLDPRVHVNSTRYIKSTQVVANVTITGDALVDSYDVVVATASGKKGIGTEAFAVQFQAEVMAGGYHVNSVNQNGDAVGDVTNPVSTCTGPLPTLWRADGTRVTLPLGAFCGGSPLAINASGVILGSLFGGVSNSRGMWIPSGGTYTLQILPPAPDGYRPLTGGALNDNNEIFAWGQGFARLYWWSAGTGWLSMQVPAGATSCQAANAINNRGEMAAKCTVNGVDNPFYWSSHDAAPIALPRPPGTALVWPRDINDDGVMVGTGLRWRPTPSGYVYDVFPLGSAEAIAPDGRMAGSVPGSGSSGGSPAIFYSPTSYQVLAVTSNGKWGSAGSIALTATGIVLGGTEANSKALRWKLP